MLCTLFRCDKLLRSIVFKPIQLSVTSVTRKQFSTTVNPVLDIDWTHPVAPTPWGTGARAHTFTNGWARGAPWVEKQPTRNWPNCTDYWPSQKRSPKRLIVLLEPKKVEGHDHKIFFLRFATDRCPPPSTFAPDRGAPHFQIRSGATGSIHGLAWFGLSWIGSAKMDPCTSNSASNTNKSSMNMNCVQMSSSGFLTSRREIVFVHGCWLSSTELFQSLLPSPLSVPRPPAVCSTNYRATTRLRRILYINEYSAVVSRLKILSRSSPDLLYCLRRNDLCHFGCTLIVCAYTIHHCSLFHSELKTLLYSENRLIPPPIVVPPQWSFRETGTMGTLAILAEIDVWV